MRNPLRFLPLFLVPVLLGGCRYKGWESFYSATTSAETRNQTDPADGPVKGDPASFGSLAGANGGLKSETNYGAGANVASTGKLNPVMDQPEKGSGQDQGYYPNVAAPGYGQDNGPALQPSPGSVGDVGAPLAHG